MRNKKKSILNLILRLYKQLPFKRKLQLILIFFMMIVGSLVEIMSIGTVIPFIGMLSDPESFLKYKEIKKIIAILGLSKKSEIMLTVTTVFIFSSIIAGLVKQFLLWLQTRISLVIGIEFSERVYRAKLYQPYSMHISTNSSEMISGIQKANNLVFSILQPTLIILSSILTLLFVLFALFLLDAKITTITFLSFGISYLIIVFFVKSKVTKNSQIISKRHGNVTKAMQEGFGAIRDVIIHCYQESFIRIYKDSLIPYLNANASNLIVGASPRYLMETIGLVLIALLAFSLSLNEGSINKSMPILAVLALSAQRMLPILQQIYSSYINIKGTQESTQDALNSLEQPSSKYSLTPFTERVSFTRSIKFSNVFFKYPSSDSFVLSNINIEIKKGSRVGIIGTSGSGKSTFLDVLMGLLQPTSGYISIDGLKIDCSNVQSWQTCISHVPQSIFLTDASIAENIAFGIPENEINYGLVKVVSEKAQLADTVEKFPHRYKTRVGERGVMISGGQRQRIGIARALYRNSDLLVLDEATSALDFETENLVMDTLELIAPDITVIIVAHRLSTLRKCDKIYKLTNQGQLIVSTDH
jgi:ABC-type multidrug transport system fused ATPase/permease subunit